MFCFIAIVVVVVLIFTKVVRSFSVFNFYALGTLIEGDLFMVALGKCA